MKELKCTNCGAALTPDGKCEYCGARFRIEELERPMLLQIEHPKVVPLIGETLVDRRIVAEYGEAAARKVKHDMAYKMAAELEKVMDLQISDDPWENAVRVRGRIRVVLPGIEF